MVHSVVFAICFIVVALACVFVGFRFKSANRWTLLLEAAGVVGYSVSYAFIRQSETDLMGMAIFMVLLIFVYVNPAILKAYEEGQNG